MARKEEIEQAALINKEIGLSDIEYFILGAEWADEHQAEKDLELTWEEIYNILYFEREVLREFGNEEHSNEEVCKEVLKRFKAQKGEEI